MHSALSSILRNLILLALLAVSALNLYYVFMGWQDLIVLQLAAGLVYIFLSCYEFLNRQYRAGLPVQRFPYFSNGYLMVKALKTLIFIGIGVLLLISGNRMRYLYPLCFLVAATDLIVLLLKYRRELCFVSLYANYIMLAEDQVQRVFASQLRLVEYRHEILYFVRKNGKTLQINLSYIGDKARFLASINDWLQRNRVPVGEESAEKLRAA